MSKRVHFCFISNPLAPQFPLLLFSQRTMASLALEWNHFQALALKLTNTPVVHSRSLAWRLWSGCTPGLTGSCQGVRAFTVNIVMVTPSSALMALLRKEGWTCAKGDLKIELSNTLSFSHLPLRKSLTVLFGHCITENNGKCLWNVWH